MTRRPRRFRGTYLVAASLAFLLFGGATVGWARSRDADAFGLRFGSQDLSGPVLDRPHRPAPSPDAVDRGDGDGSALGGLTPPAGTALPGTASATAKSGRAGGRPPGPVPTSHGGADRASSR